MLDIVHRIEIDAERGKVFEALSRQSGLAGWWTTDVRAETHVGGICKFRFGAGGGADMEVLEVQAPHLLRWRCAAGPTAWVNTTIIFRLGLKESTASAAGTTVLRFTQRGFAAENDDYAHANTKWAIYLLSLKQLVETGRGAPWPNDVKIGRVR
ncbi:MAG: SRPBCC family protein [Phycisphaerales bacterium]